MRPFALCAAGVLLAVGVAVVGLGSTATAQPPEVAAPGVVAPGSTYTPVTPTRVLDTRTGNGATGPVGPASTITLDLSGRVPITSTAVVLNVTGTDPTAATFVTVFPNGAPRPLASNLNLVAGETRPNLVTVALGTGRKLSLYNNAGLVHLIADLAGHYSTDAGGGRFTALPPTRLMDTRQGQPVGSGGTTVLDLTGNVPASATAVTFNLTGTDATANTFVTAWPMGRPRPTVSNLNLVRGQTAANLVTVEIGDSFGVRLFNNFGTTHLIADLAGFYTPDYGSTFTPVTPMRVFDTRSGTGTEVRPFGGGETRELGLGTQVPGSASAVVLNVTGTNPTADTFLTAWPAREDARPVVSNLNLVRGQTAPNLVAVGLGQGRAVALFNRIGLVDVIADLAGYFALPEAPCAGDCVVAWGSNRNRQLGVGSPEESFPAPRPVYGLSGVTQVAGTGTTGLNHNGYAVHAVGTVSAWGDNAMGQLGNGWFGGRSETPVPVVGLDRVTQVAAGWQFAIALREDGTVWRWGLLNGLPAQVPVLVSELSGIVAVSAGWSTAYAIRDDGTLWALGRNDSGQLGDGSTNFSPVPVQVSGLTGVTLVVGGGYDAHAVLEDGSVWSWGRNNDGLLGNDTPCSTVCYSTLPVQVTGLTGATWIAADGHHVFAVQSDGTVVGWGDQSTGSLGNGSLCACAVSHPVPLTGLSGIKMVAGFGTGGYALRGDGSLLGWGSNSRGQLSDAPLTDPFSAVPVPIAHPSGLTAIVAGHEAGFALVATV